MADFGTPGSAIALPSKKRWQRERAIRVHRFFETIERRRQRGMKLSKAFHWLRWWCRQPDRVYRCDPSRRMRLSPGTLKRLYYKWRRDGRTPEALKLEYWTRQKIDACHVQQCVRVALAPSFRSLRSAYRALPEPAATYHAFRHVIPAELRRNLRSLFQARQTAIRLEKAARESLRKWEEKGS